ncbi:MAG: NfeD family protein [Dehalococcoidales bacterium]
MGKKIDIELIRRTAKDWLKVLVLLLDEVAALFIVILVLRFFEIKLPLIVTVIIALIAGTLIFIVHKAVIPSFHRKQVSGREGMIGLQGRVVESLTPIGVVTVAGEYWKAKSADENIEVDEDVEIIGIDGLTLRVQHKEQ